MSKCYAIAIAIILSKKGKCNMQMAITKQVLHNRQLKIDTYTNNYIINTMIRVGGNATIE